MIKQAAATPCERARLGVRPSWGGCGRGPPAAPGGSRRPAAHAAWMARTRAAASSASALPATARSHLRAAARAQGGASGADRWGACQT
jgi:hypothetical protein